MPGEASETQIRELELVVERDPSTALYLPLAERLRDMGRVEDAIRLCETRKTRPGRGVGDAIVLGRCYLADGRLAEARSEFEAALRLDRENVIALKALGGILAHEGRHARAVEMYRAVCRIDPGDLESQTALHQITSGEFAEVSPADVVVGQGDLGWHPVRLPREEDHLADLGMGLRMIDTFDAPAAAPTAERRKDHGFREFSLDDLDRKKPASAPAASSAAAPPAAPAASTAAPAPPAPTAHAAAPAPSQEAARMPAPPRPELVDSLERFDVPTPVAPVEEIQAALGAPLEAPRAQLPAPAPAIESAHAPAAAEVDAPAAAEVHAPAAAEAPAASEPAGGPPASTAPAALEPAATATPVAQVPAAPDSDATPESPATEQGTRGEGYKHSVSGNKSAFQEWLRRLGGGA
jgi:tetratricopeptide (TPR) repeat protein